MKKKATSLALIAVLVLLSTGGCRNEETFGVLDIQKVIDGAPLAREYQEQLDRRGKEIEDEFLKDSQDLSEEEKMARQQEAYQKYVGIKQEMEEKLNEKIEEAVRNVAEEKNLTAVLYKQAVRYGGVDVTQAVIEELSREEE